MEQLNQVPQNIPEQLILLHSEDTSVLKPFLYLWNFLVYIHIVAKPFPSPYRAVSFLPTDVLVTMKSLVC